MRRRAARRRGCASRAAAGTREAAGGTPAGLLDEAAARRARVKVECSSAVEVRLSGLHLRCCCNSAGNCKPRDRRVGSCWDTSPCSALVQSLFLPCFALLCPDLRNPSLETEEECSSALSNVPPRNNRIASEARPTSRRGPAKLIHKRCAFVFSILPSRAGNTRVQPALHQPQLAPPWHSSKPASLRSFCCPLNQTHSTTRRSRQTRHAHWKALVSARKLSRHSVPRLPQQMQERYHRLPVMDEFPLKNTHF